MISATQPSPTADKQNHDAQWHILGAGAIGCLYAYFLGAKATLLLKPERFTAQVAAHECFREDRSESERASSNPIDLEITLEHKGTLETFRRPCLPSSSHHKISKLLICTKAQHTRSAVQSLNLGEHASIVLLQNGMGSYEFLKQRFPDATLYCASSTHGAYRKSPWHIVHAGQGQSFFGFFQQQAIEQQTLEQQTLTSIRYLEKSLSSAKEPFRFDPKMSTRLWMKLAINCAINPLSALYQCQNGALISKQNYLQHLRSLCQEIDTLFRALQVIDAGESILETVCAVAQATADNYSSMYQDVHHKRSTEIEFIQGYLCQEASKLGLQLPKNQEVLNTIREIEAGY